MHAWSLDRGWDAKYVLIGRDSAVYQQMEYLRGRARRE